MNYVDIEDRSLLERIINGALKNAITVHGPLTLKNYSSASKRIYGELKGLAKRQRVTKNN